jgi:hypothetical protein
MASIISIMITTVFGMGSPTEQDKADYMNSNFVGSSMDQLYSISVALLIIVVIFIPIMLFTNPCLACGNSGEHHTEHSIELVS